MPAQHEMNVVELAEHPCERLWLEIRVRVHVWDTASKRRVMKHHDRWLRPVGRERRPQPVQPGLINISMVQPRNSRVEPHDSDRIVVDTVMHRASLRKVSMVRERRPERLAPVMVARDDQVRNSQFAEQPSGRSVLIWVSLIDHVPREHD